MHYALRDRIATGPSNDSFGNTIDARLQQAGLPRGQVQVVWLKEANARPTERQSIAPHPDSAIVV